MHVLPHVVHVRDTSAYAEEKVTREGCRWPCIQYRGRVGKCRTLRSRLNRASWNCRVGGLDISQAIWTARRSAVDGPIPGRPACSGCPYCKSQLGCVVCLSDTRASEAARGRSVGCSRDGENRGKDQAHRRLVLLTRQRSVTKEKGTSTLIVCIVCSLAAMVKLSMLLFGIDLIVYTPVWNGAGLVAARPALSWPHRMLPDYWEASASSCILGELGEHWL
jgi:hypothetical protein